MKYFGYFGKILIVICCGITKLLLTSSDNLNKFHLSDHSMIMPQHNQHYQITLFFVHLTVISITADEQNHLHFIWANPCGANMETVSKTVWVPIR